jgi:hypothetical protein
MWLVGKDSAGSATLLVNVMQSLSPQPKACPYANVQKVVFTSWSDNVQTVCRSVAAVLLCVHRKEQDEGVTEAQVLRKQE